MTTTPTRSGRDARVREGIERWLRVHDDSDTMVGALRTPATGLSAETWFVPVRTANVRSELVVRVAPAGDGLFPHCDLELQVALQNQLHEAGIPAVPARYEPDPAWVGAPFMVMRRIAGRTVTTRPPYVTDGWLAELRPERQREVVGGLCTVLGRLHRAVPVEGPGRSPEELVDAAAEYLAWAAGGRPAPRFLTDALDWLRTEPPAAGSPVRLWGDVQLPNCVFARSGAVAAVLDFELTDVGPPEVDLGWFLALHDMTAATAGADLPGLADRSVLLAAYEDAAGRQLGDLRWYRGLAMVRSGSIMVRLARLLAARGVDDGWLTRGNPTEAALARLRSEE